MPAFEAASIWVSRLFSVVRRSGPAIYAVAAAQAGAPRSSQKEFHAEIHAVWSHQVTTGRHAGFFLRVCQYIEARDSSLPQTFCPVFENRSTRLLTAT